MPSKTRKKNKSIHAPGWPYYKKFIDQEILKSRIKEMQNLKFKISNKPRQPIALKLKTRVIKPTFKNKFITFVDDDYLKYDILPLVYSEPELIKCRFRGNEPAIDQYKYQANHLWADFKKNERVRTTKKTLKKSSISLGSNAENININARFREYLFKHVKACNNYRPTLAMQTYWFLGNAKTVLDFSAGWGDRLFASCITNVKYIGLDPNINNRPFYDEIITNHGSINNQRVISTGAEYLPDGILLKTMKELDISQFDLIATSPPYYDYEVYSDTAQSAMGFTDAPKWLIFWLGQIIYKYCKFLRPGGYLALYIQDTGPHTYVEPLVMFILSNPDLFAGLECCGLIHSTRFPMVILQKPSSPSQTSSTGQMAALFKSKYPIHYKLGLLWRKVHQYLYDVDQSDSLTRTVVKYFINMNNKKAYCPNLDKYVDLANKFSIQLDPSLTMDELFIELWQESIAEYKLLYGKHQLEKNIPISELMQVYKKLFN